MKANGGIARATNAAYERAGSFLKNVPYMAQPGKRIGLDVLISMADITDALPLEIKYGRHH